MSQKLVVVTRARVISLSYRPSVDPDSKVNPKLLQKSELLKTRTLALLTSEPQTPSANRSVKLPKNAPNIEETKTKVSLSQ